MNDRGSESGQHEKPLILAIDDDPEALVLLSHLLHSVGYRTVSAETGSMGLALAERYKPNVIILDLNMPDMDGLVVCRELKARRVTVDIPVLFGTGAERTDETVARCFEVGAHDFLSKPFNRVDLFARLRVVLREQATLESYRRLATEDPSTGLSNRRQFVRDVEEAIARTRHASGECVLLLADIDGLAQTQERFGHEFGDELIITFSRLLKRLNSPDCKSGRIGDDDFGIVLTEASRQRGLKLAERLRRTFASIVFDAESDPKHFSAGFGLAAWDGRPADLSTDAFLGQADTALCVAKDAGRNRIVAFWQLDPDALPEIHPERRRTRAKSRCPTERAFIGVPETGRSGGSTPASHEDTPTDDSR